MKYLISAIFIALFCILDSPVAAQYINPDGNLESLSVDDIWPQTLEGGHYNEMWNYQFYLNDDITVHVAFSVANFGSFKDPVSGLQISIYNLDGELYQVSREYPINQLIQDRQRNLFQLHPNRTIYFQGKLPQDHKVHAEFTKHGVYYKVELDFKNIHDGYKWGDGIYQIENEGVGIITHIPYAEVQGSIAVGDVERSVKGTAYMDHTYQDRAATNIVESGYRFVHQDNKDNWDLLYYLLPKNTSDNSTVGFRLTNNEGNITVNGIDRISRMNSSETFGVDVARIMDMHMDDDTDIRISRTEDFEKFSILNELSWLARKAAKSFLGGEVISIRGEAILMEAENRPKRGFYNFYVVD